MQFDETQLRYEDGLWLGAVLSQFGVLELILNGSEERPDEQELLAFRRFAMDLDQNIARLQQRIIWGFLYRPIRIAINIEKRVGVQFRNRLTGSQGTLILE